MKSLTIQPNIFVIDTDSILPKVEAQYYKFIYDESVLKERESKKIYLYFTYKTIVETLKEQKDNRKNIIFFINKKSGNFRFNSCINKIAKFFPIIIYEGEKDFDCLTHKNGETLELEILLKNKRFSFDYSIFSKRKMQQFLKCNGFLEPTFPA